MNSGEVKKYCIKSDSGKVAVFDVEFTYHTNHKDTLESVYHLVDANIDDPNEKLRVIKSVVSRGLYGTPKVTMGEDVIKDPELAKIVTDKMDLLIEARKTCM